MASEIQLFINELSLQGQYASLPELQRALVVFIRLMEAVRKAEIKGVLRHEQLAANFDALHGQSLQVSLNRLTDRTYREQLIDTVFNRVNPAPWQPSRVHSPNHFYFLDYQRSTEELVTDHTPAELAERQHRTTAFRGALLNFTHSSLADRKQVTISRLDDNLSYLWAENLPCLETAENLMGWLSLAGRAEPYLSDARRPPDDEQTCLGETSRFERTGRVEQGRQIYREHTTGRLWYVDNQHVGDSAHLEVFSKRGQHEFEAELDGKARLGSKKPGRTIDPP